MVQPHIAQKRRFLPAHFAPANWDALQPHFAALENTTLDSAAALLAWLGQCNELQAAIKEELAWRYIRMTCNTQDEEAAGHYQYFVQEISPKVAAAENRLLQRYDSCPHRHELPSADFGIFNQMVANQLALFREVNLELKAQIETKSQEYGARVAEMTVMVEGQDITLQQAAAYLEKPDRETRAEVWEKMMRRRLRDRDAFNTLFDDLLALRTQVARNAGFGSYTDYKFLELDRFDYGRDTCTAFHESVERLVTPVYVEFQERRRQQMGLHQLRPWDMAVDSLNREPLRPFATAPELVRRTVECLAKLKPELGGMIAEMHRMGHLDLDSRVGKAPGGYNYPLAETGVPFIFMNAVGLQADLTTMVHEAGHAIHSFLTRDLAFNFWKEVPSETAELASMSMELLSMHHWGVFYDDPELLSRARRHQIERALLGLPWIACVDAFQTWVYDNPTHTHAQRDAQWLELYDRFHGQVVDFTGYEAAKANLWQRQLHIFEVPFYYIEYGMAQVGAFQVWRNYTRNPQQAVEAYLAALALGYTRPIPDVYAAAEVEFNFSNDFLASVFEFVVREYQRYKQPS